MISVIFTIFFFTSSILHGTVCKPFLLSLSVYTLFSTFRSVSRAWMDVFCVCTHLVDSSMNVQSLSHALLSMHKSA